jgi:hypothetical protein
MRIATGEAAETIENGSPHAAWPPALETLLRRLPTPLSIYGEPKNAPKKIQERGAGWRLPADFGWLAPELTLKVS